MHYDKDIDEDPEHGIEVFGEEVKKLEPEHYGDINIIINPIIR